MVTQTEMIRNVPLRLAGIGRSRARLALWPLAVGFAVATLASARAHPDGSFAGSAFPGATIELGAAIALAAAGLLFWTSRTRNLVGPLLVAASVAWLLPEWSNPETATALLFTLGLAGSLACLPIVIHIGLAYPRGHVRHRYEQAVVAVAYAGAIVLVGLVPTAVFDPRAGGCTQCPSNLLLIHGNASLNEHVSRFGIRFMVVWSIVAALTLVVRGARSSVPALKAAAPVLVAALGYLGLSTADLWHSVSRGYLSNDSADVRLWRAQGIALILLAAAVISGLIRARRTRTSVAQLVIELGRAPRVGGARETLATTLRDPSLELAYRRAPGPGYVDVDGNPLSPGVSPGRAATPLVREGREIAVILHADHLLSDPGVIEDATAAARLAVENEQLQAEVNAQMREIRASRARIVEATDAERRRLERDLHDGAQQRLVALSLALRLLRNAAARGGPSDAIPALENADGQLREALAELREVAHGIYPAVLGDEGLAAALETLAERLPPTLRLGNLPGERFSAPVEAAAYFTAAEIVRDLGDDTAASIDVGRVDGRLVVAVERAGPLDDADERLVEIGDRIRALDGEIYADAGSTGSVRMEARIPCA
ncbi:MAG: sensor histidine kinase [Thermoleophilaceae bacterium]